MSVRIIIAEALDELRKLPSDSVHCCVTSPPYWGLRDYGIEPSVWGGDDPACSHQWGAPNRTAWANAVPGPASRTGGSNPGKNGSERRCEAKVTGPFCEHCGAWLGTLGLEPYFGLYVENMLAVFREVRRVLRPDGTLWLNLGDSYATGAGKVGEHPGGGDQGARWAGTSSKRPAMGKQAYLGNGIGVGPSTQPNRLPQPGLKPKDLVGIPWRVAFALQADGWWLRQDIIWSKPNPMPESVTDRCTKAHEYLFLLSKSERYWFDAAAIKEDSITNDPRRPYTSEGAWQLDGRPVEQRHGGKPRTAGNKSHKYVEAYEASDTEEHRTKAGLMGVADVPWASRNRRSVWTVASEPFPEAHFATFPPALIEPCILAGCPKDGTVLDPFGGAGTTGLVADRLGRDAILIELNPEYAAMARRRIDCDRGPLLDIMEANVSTATTNGARSTPDSITRPAP